MKTTKKEARTVRVSARVTRSLKRKLDALCRKRKWTISDCLDEALILLARSASPD